VTVKREYNSLFPTTVLNFWTVRITFFITREKKKVSNAAKANEKRRSIGRKGILCFSSQNPC